jgi:hypothetical protein
MPFKSQYKKWKKSTEKFSFHLLLLMISLQGIRAVAVAETIFPATPGPSPATKSPFIVVSKLLSVATCVAKNLISGA